jgi:uncharacterized membrane protein
MQKTSQVFPQSAWRHNYMVKATGLAACRQVKVLESPRLAALGGMVLLALGALCASRTSSLLQAVLPHHIVLKLAQIQLRLLRKNGWRSKALALHSSFILRKSL